MAEKTTTQKILIVEDEALLSEMYADAFRKEGYTVVSAASEEEASDIIKTASPDFILLDIVLPGKNGVEFLKKVKSDSKVASIPVFIFSNLDDPKIQEQAMELGAQAYILKTSFTPQQLISKVREFMK